MMTVLKVLCCIWIAGVLGMCIGLVSTVVSGWMKDRRANDEIGGVQQ